MPRFYYFFDSADVNAPLVLPPEAVHHAMRVLRMRQGDAVEIFNGKGCAVKGTIRFATDFAEVIPQEVIMQPRDLKLVLLQALVANEKMQQSSGGVPVRNGLFFAVRQFRSARRDFRRAE